MGKFLLNTAALIIAFAPVARGTDIIGTWSERTEYSLNRYPYRNEIATDRLTWRFLPDQTFEFTGKSSRHGSPVTHWDGLWSFGPDACIEAGINYPDNLIIAINTGSTDLCCYDASSLGDRLLLVYTNRYCPGWLRGDHTLSRR